MGSHSGGADQVVMLTTGAPHPSHRGFAESVGADVVDIASAPGVLGGTTLEDAWNGLRASVPDCEVALLEGSGELYATPRVARAADRTVFLCDDHRLLGRRCYDFRGGSVPKRLLKYVDRWADETCLRAALDRHVDGVVAGSGLLAGVARDVAGPELPVRVANPYIQPDVFERLGAVEPDLSANTAVTVGVGRDHKGVGRLVDAWPAVRDRVPDAELVVVGPGHPARFERTPGVSLTGYVDPAELDRPLSAASLYVHPARAEAFGVTVVEAMRAGLPAVVTRTTGARSAVRAVDRSLVVEPSRTALVDRVVDYFALDTPDRRALSARAAEVGGEYDADSGRATFRRQFDRLLEDIGEQ